MSDMVSVEPSPTRMILRGTCNIVAGIWIASAASASAQQFDFPPAARTDTTVLAAFMPKLAADVSAAYRGTDRRVYLSNLFRLQTVAGSYRNARSTLAEFQTALGNSLSQEVRAANVLYLTYAAAMQREGTQSADGRLREQLREVLATLDDETSAMVIRALSFNPQGALNAALRRQGSNAIISLTDALGFIRAYHTRQVVLSLARVAPPVVAEDDTRRYVVESNLQVRTPDGGTVCALVVRPRDSTQRLPALLNFTIYADTIVKLIDSRRAASRGYAGVVGFTRGKLCSPDPIEPYEHDGADAAALIDWIAKQSWSDGRVGMYGGSYEGFTQWAAAKYMPSALKTMIPAVPVAPGLDVPMEGNVFVNFVYPWPFFTTNNRTLDSATYNQFARWNRLNREWYVSGCAYRDLDKIDGTPNPIFDRWIAHPTYDAYWRGMIPYGDEFARVNIPVLQTMGYFFGGPGGAEYYYREHYKHNPTAQHYLVAGPYDHVPGQRGVVNIIGDTVYDFAGYRLDEVALQDLWHLRYQWFDWIFKGAPKPAMLADKVNYQVMGGNVWVHAPSIAAMSNGKMRLWLRPERSLTVDLGNRADIDRNVAGGGIVNTEIDTVDALKFSSDPVSVRTEVSGLFSGRLDVITNKRDFDAYIGLYELNAKGEYFMLATWQMRASHASDLAHRRLLVPGKVERLDFTSIRLTSRMLEKGSRIVAVVGPIKAPVLQLNLGSGKDVSDETIADAGVPLTIRWLGSSYIDVPIWRPAVRRPR
jgi:uncharacterized protein